MANPSDQIRQEFLQPASDTVQTYTGPPRSNLRDFVSALAGLDSSLNTFIEQRAAKFREEQKIRGEAAFQRNHQMGYAEAVRQGLIPPQASGSFMRAYKMSEGALAGQQLKEKYAEAYRNWDGKYSEDPTAYSQFLGQFITENVGTNDPYVLKGLLPHLNEVTQNGFAQHTKDLGDQLYQNSLDSHVAQANKDINEGNAEGLVTGTGTDYPAVFEAIKTRRQSFVDAGGDPRDFDKSIIDAMAIKVLATRDPGLLGFFDQKVPGQDFTYGESEYGAKVKQNTIESLEVIARRDAADEAALKTARDKEEKDRAWSEAIDSLSADPMKALPDELVERGKKYDPKFLINIEEWRKSLAEGFSDPAAVKAVYAEILGGGGIASVRDAFAHGVFGRPEDLASAMAFARSYEDNKSKIEDAMSSGSAASIMSAIDVRTKGKDNIGQPLQGVSNEGFQAQYDFRRLVSEWTIQHPDATLLEREEAIAKIGKGILDRITVPQNFTESGRYLPEPGLSATTGNPYGPQIVPQPEPQAQPQATQEAPAQGDTRSLAPPPPAAQPQAQPDAATSGDPAAHGIDPSWDKATPEQRQIIEAEAAKMGIHPLEVYRQLGLQPPDGIKYGTLGTSGNRVIDHMINDTKDNPNAITLEEYSKRLGEAGKPMDWLNGLFNPLHQVPDLPPEVPKPMQYQPGDGYNPALDNGALDARPVSFTPEEATAFIDTAISQAANAAPSGQNSIKDPFASNLAAFIGAKEANGNYNAVYGNAGSTVDLSQFTLDQILGAQEAARKAGAASTAVGIGQFVYKTLKGLKEELGLSGKEPFTPELQDQLVHTLLVRRGLEKYKAGKITKSQFALRLSQEWAALPNPSTGRSYYDGDGLNSALTTTAKVYEVLGFTGTPKAASVPEAYRNIPANEVAQFVKWNSDPIANQEQVLADVNPDLSSVVRRAQEIAGVQFVAASGKRDAELQKQAVGWGWSKTMHSDHLHGEAVDLWPLKDGAVVFDKNLQMEVVKAMQQAAKELGVSLDIGAMWKNQDLPHFAINGRNA